ncbi:DUF1697 domain-containing protein [Rubripirellula reticaptiva]|uniref:DUF1697 domain-containing protein n=1 Tax=Rubripirellula reticaptiva TaxID=2528013 RepID=A0A5C6ED01_9BACT|nr:DUF1697 domain-containing protein [Rubripirellula reticaptiva]TWU46902.1 hypothetical protein Poly59_58760 [Rubripirellula reticaptiva]
MQTWIALFRGINVGGNNALPMASLKRILESLKCVSVRTYIQSGNVVFQSSQTNTAAFVKKIRAAVGAEHGFEPHVLVLSRADLQAADAANPFADAIAEPKTLHFFFLQSLAASRNTVLLDQTKTNSEAYAFTDRVFYLHTPDGFGQSKLAKKAEKILGVTATARNYRTVEKLLAMADADSSD